MRKDLVTTEIIVKEKTVGILRVGNVNYFFNGFSKASKS